MTKQNNQNLDDRWNSYYKAVQGRKPRKLFLEALPYANYGKALDAGAGDLTESQYLLEQGFSVVAVDSSQTSEDLARGIKSNAFRFVRSELETFEFPKEEFDLVTAQLVLPFVKPGHSERVFANIVALLKKGGVFVGQLFGPNDEWNTAGSDMSFHDREQISQMLEGLKIEKLLEEEADRKTAAGKQKHWHVFEVIAVK